MSPKRGKEERRKKRRKERTKKGNWVKRNTKMSKKAVYVRLVRVVGDTSCDHE